MSSSGETILSWTVDSEFTQKPHIDSVSKKKIAKKGLLKKCLETSRPSSITKEPQHSRVISKLKYWP